MRLYTRTKRRLASRQLVSAMGSRYQRKQTTRTAGQLGNGLSVIDGQLYDTGATNGHGTVAVVNVGRAAAAVYLPQSNGQVQISAGGGSCGSSGGTGIGIHALDGAYHTGTLAQSQAPWAALDSDLQDHMADPVHHDRQHSVTSVDDHTVSAARYSVLGTPTAANTLAMWATSSNGTAGNALLRTDSNGAIYLNDLYAYDKVQSQSYVPGFAGSGYRLDYAVTSAGKSFLEVDDLSVRRRMTIRELLIRKIRTTNGDLFVSSGGEVESATDLGGGSWRLTFREAHGFLVDDLIAAQAWTGAGVFRLEATVTAAPSTNQIDITLDDGGGETPATILAAGLALSFARHGSTSDPDRQGLLYLSSDDTGAPFLRVLDGIDAWADWGDPATVKMQAGRLDGITDAVLGDLSGYGLYGQNVYLTGILAAGGGDAVMGAEGLNIQAGTVSDGGWTNHSDKITFAADPLADLDAENTISQIGAVQFTSGSEIHRRLAARVQAGTAEQADAAIIELLAQYVDPEAAVPIQYAGVTMGVSDGAPYVSVGLQGSSAAAGSVLLQAPAITAYGHILADTDSAHDIGTADNRFRRLYVDEIVAGTTSSTDTGHNHDDRYYTKSTIDTALAGKAATTHDHAGLVSDADLAAELADYATIAYVDAEIAAVGAPDLGDYWTKAEADDRYTGLITHNAHIADTAAHGATGAVVGTTNTQTLTNKTLTAPTVTGTMAAAAATFSSTIGVTGAATFSGAVNVDGGVLYVSAANDRVGINTASPAYVLDVNRNADAVARIQIKNTNTGAAAMADISVVSGAAGVALQRYNTNHTGTWDDLTLGGHARLRTDSAVAGLIVATGGDAPIIFGTNDTRHWEITGDGELRSLNPAWSADRQGVRLTPGGIFEAGQVRIRGEIEAAVLSFEEKVIHAGADLWTPNGGAMLGTDITPGAAGDTVTFDILDGQINRVARALANDYLRITTPAEYNLTAYGGYAGTGSWDIAPIGLYRANSGFGSVDLWLKVTAYERNAGDDGYTYTADVISNSFPNATIRAGAGIANYGNVISPPGEIGYIAAIANDGASPRIEIGRIGAAPWAGEEYPTVILGKIDTPVLRTNRHGILITTNANDEGAPYFVVDSGVAAMNDISINMRENGRQFLTLDGRGLRLDTISFANYDTWGWTGPASVAESPRRIEFVDDMAGGTGSVLGSIAQQTGLDRNNEVMATQLNIGSGRLGTPGEIFARAVRANGTAGGQMTLDSNGAQLTGDLIDIGNFDKKITLRSKGLEWLSPQSFAAAYAAGGNIYNQQGFLRVLADNTDTVTFTDAVEISKAQNAVTRATIENSSTGAAAVADLYVTNGATGVTVQMWGTGATSTWDSVSLDTMARIRTASAAEGLIVTTGGAKSLHLGTADTKRISISGAGVIDVAGTWGTWATLTPGSGWEAYGSGFQAPQYKRVGDLVYVRGLVRRSSGSSGSGTVTVATLPSGFRPAATNMAIVMASAGGAATWARVDVDSNGVIKTQGLTYTGSGGEYVSLNFAISTAA